MMNLNINKQHFNVQGLTFMLQNHSLNFLVDLFVGSPRLPFLFDFLSRFSELKCQAHIAKKRYTTTSL